MGILTGLSLFSGAGGLDLAAKWSGIRTVCYVENDPYAQGVLMSRMRDGSLDRGPIWDDVRTFDGKPWAGKVDCVFGGFPCQDISVAGNMQGIQEGNRSGLWKEFARIIREVGPKYVLVENVAAILVGGGLGIVLRDLAKMGRDAEWGVYGACAVGAPHTRERMFLVSDSNGVGLSWGPDTRSSRSLWETVQQQSSGLLQTSTWVEKTKAEILGMDDGMAEAVDRSRCCGNGVVPQQALPAFQKILEMSKG